MPNTLFQRARILIVDDEIAVVDVVRRTLARHGYLHLEATTNSFDAVRLFNDWQPDLVVLDLLMPGLDGMQVLGQLQAIIPPDTYLPILIVTGYTSADVRNRALRGGASDFIGKPYDALEIVLRVDNLLRTRFLHVAIAEQQAGLEQSIVERTAELTAANARLQLEIVMRRETERVLRDGEARLAASEEAWKQSFDAIPDHLCILDQSGKILRANRTMKERFEPVHGNLIGLDYRLCYCGTTTPDPQPPCAAVLSGAPAVAFEGRLPALDGWWWIASYPLCDETQIQCGAISVVRDVTAHREAKEAVGEAHAELESRVLARTSELAAVNDALVVEIGERRRAQLDADQANRAKSEFLSRMSHELRTPLNAILGFGQLMKSDGHAADRAENVDQILTAGHHLLTLVDEVLDIASADAGILSLPAGAVTFGAAENRVLALEHATPAVAPPPAAARPFTVLYIEDNPSNFRLVERLLSRRPAVTLLHSPKGLAGIELARAHRPDLILLDLHLPDIDGGRVLEQLVSDPRTADVPVIIISADATRGQIARLTAAGARAYLTKPLDVRTFLDAVDGFLLGPRVPAVRP